MIVDVNLLLYAATTADPRGDAAADWLENVLNGPIRVGLPWQSLHGFVRLATNSRIFPRAMSGAVAMAQVDDWLQAPAAWVPQPGRNHSVVLSDLITRYRLAGDLVPDAALAALALENGTGIWSTDADFARFPELRWENPLASR